MKALVVDLARVTSRRPWILSFIKSYLLDRGFQAVALYRLAHWLVTRRMETAATLVTNYSLAKTGAEILPHAEIGPGFLVRHPVGLVVGSRCRIGRDFTALQGVTLGEKYSQDGRHECPIIEDQVTVCAGAKVLGAVHIGRGSVVGANAVVIHDIPAHVVAAGAPARRIGDLVSSPSVRSSGSPVEGRVCQLVENGEGGSLVVAGGREDGGPS